MDGLLNDHIFLVAKYKRRNEVIFLFGIAMTPEQLTIIDIDDGYFFSFIIALIADECFISDLFAIEIRWNQL